MNLSKINAALIWAAVTTTVSAVVWMFTTFARADDVDALKDDLNTRLLKQEVAAAYGQFYDRLDDYEEALDEGRDGLADEYKRQMERLRAFICKHEPEWERC